MIRTSHLFLAAVGFAATVLIAAHAGSTRPLCQREPHWFDIVFLVFGPLSVIAIFGANLSYLRTSIRDELSRTAAALFGAVVWAAVGGYVVLALLWPAGCFST